MGLFNKIKGILFEEVEDDEVVDTPKPKVSEAKKPIAERIEPQKREEVVINTPPKVEVPKEVKHDQINERDLFKSDNTFPFQEFDEKEFESMSRVNKPKPTTNVLEYEKKKKIEKKYDLGRYERVEKTEVVERRKFKPSPIISPVYGILNEDYKPEDIKEKKVDNKDKAIDFNSVRKKAFGEISKEEPTSYYEETVTVKLKENEEEKKQKVKTIDELLEDTSDVVVDINDEVEPEENVDESKTEEVVEPEVMDYESVDKDLEDLKPKHEEKSSESVDDDTFENDLFDLIDSMYDNREDGDI